MLYVKLKTEDRTSNISFYHLVLCQ